MAIYAIYASRCVIHVYLYLKRKKKKKKMTKGKIGKQETILNIK